MAVRVTRRRVDDKNGAPVAAPHRRPKLDTVTTCGNTHGTDDASREGKGEAAPERRSDRSPPGSHHGQAPTSGHANPRLRLRGPLRRRRRPQALGTSPEGRQQCTIGWMLFRTWGKKPSPQLAIAHSTRAPPSPTPPLRPGQPLRHRRPAQRPRPLHQRRLLGPPPPRLRPPLANPAAVSGPVTGPRVSSARSTLA